MTLVVLDGEAISALGDPRSSKHQRTLAVIESQRGRSRRRPTTNEIVVPSTVRVEAGWDRTAPAAAVINRFGIADHHLDEATTNVAARLRKQHGVSPADAHIGACAQRPQAVVVVTSDPKDIRRVAPVARIFRL